MKPTHIPLILATSFVIWCNNADTSAVQKSKNDTAMTLSNSPKEKINTTTSLWMKKLHELFSKETDSIARWFLQTMIEHYEIYMADENNQHSYWAFTWAQENYSFYLMTQQERIDSLSRRVAGQWWATKKDYASIQNHVEHLGEGVFSFTMTVDKDNLWTYWDRASNLEGSLDFNGSRLELKNKGGKRVDTDYNGSLIKVGDTVRVTTPGRTFWDLLLLPHSKQHTQEKKDLMQSFHTINQ